MPDTHPTIQFRMKAETTGWDWTGWSRAPMYNFMHNEVLTFMDNHHVGKVTIQEEDKSAKYQWRRVN